MIRISQTYKDGKDWVFLLKSDNLSKGYKFGNKRDANRGRAKLLKTLKEKDIKVLC